MKIQHCGSSETKITIDSGDALYKRLVEGYDLGSEVTADYIKITTERDGDNFVITYTDTKKLAEFFAEYGKSSMNIDKPVQCLKIFTEAKFGADATNAPKDLKVVTLRNISEAMSIRSGHVIIGSQDFGCIEAMSSRVRVYGLPEMIVKAPFVWPGFRKTKDSFVFESRRDAYNFMESLVQEEQAYKMKKPRGKNVGYKIWRTEE